MGRTALALLTPAVVAASGCAQLFGINNTSGGGDAASNLATVQIVRRSIGATVVDSPQDVTGYTATYEVPDASDPSGLRAVPANQTAIDTWSSDLTDANPPVMFTLPDYPMAFPRLVAAPTRALKVLYGWNEHPNPTPAPAGATIHVQAALPTGFVPASETLSVFTIGSWTQYVFSGAELPAMAGTALDVTFPFMNATSLTGRPLEKITANDAFLVLRRVGNDLTGVMDATPFDQTGTDTVTGSMVPVAHDQMLTAMLAPADVAPRFAMARPAVANVYMAWYLHAAPGYLLASNLGVLLQAVSVAATDSGALNVPYGNPFVSRDWRTLMTWSTQASRSYTPTGMPPVTLYAGMYQLLEPTGSPTVGLDAGLPVTIKINSMPLLSDGMTVTRDPTKAVDLSFDVEAGHLANTLYQLTLYELVPNMGGTALEYQVVLGMTGTTPHFLAPASFFVAGHLYTLRAVSQTGGFPGLATGDFTMRSLPSSVSYLDSGVFTVTP